MASKNTAAADVQAKLDAEIEQGFRGTRVDPTPLDNYTIQGVISGKPTPETDADAKRAALDAIRKAEEV